MNLSLEIRPSYLHFTATGAFELANAESSFREIFNAASQHNLLNVLLDIGSLEGDMSVIERYLIGEFVAMHRLEHPGIMALRLAIFGKSPLVSKDRFGETVAKNRGLMIKVTDDLAEALKWLEE